jgi:hypothetical protein
VSDYGLDNQVIVVHSLAETNDFSSCLCVQIASCPIGTGGPFQGGKTQPGCDSDHWPYLVNVVVEWFNTLASYSGGLGFISQPPVTGNPDGVFLWFSSVPPGECWDSTLKLGHHQFLPIFFQFIIHLSPYH